MGLMDTIRNFLYPEDDYLEEEVEYDDEIAAQTQAQVAPSTQPESNTNRGRFSRPTVVPFQSPQTKKPTKIFVMEPSVYSEAERIADALLQGEAVIVNFRRMDKAEAKRVIDFTVGVAYAINGDVQKVRDEIFICSPASIQVQGTFDEVDEVMDAFRRQENY